MHYIWWTQLVKKKEILCTTERRSWLFFFFWGRSSTFIIWQNNLHTEVLLKHNDKVYVSQLFYLQHNIANESVSIFPVFPYTCKSTWNVLYVYILNYRKIYQGQAQESYNWGINTDLSELVWLPSSTTCIYHIRNII